MCDRRLAGKHGGHTCASGSVQADHLRAKVLKIKDSAARFAKQIELPRYLLF